MLAIYFTETAGEFIVKPLERRNFSLWSFELSHALNCCIKIRECLQHRGINCPLCEGQSSVTELLGIQPPTASH